MKTIVLHLFETKRSWTATNLRLRYVDALQKTVCFLEAKFIEHYFIQDENLLSEKDISDSELDTVKQYFEGILKYYQLECEKAISCTEKALVATCSKNSMKLNIRPTFHLLFRLIVLLVIICTLLVFNK